MRTVQKHYIGGEFVESQGKEVLESVNPSNGEVLGYVTLGDAEDARRAIAAAKKAFPAYSRTTKEERSRYLRRLHEAVSARAGDLTTVMIEEYGGPRQFSEATSARAASAFLDADAALKEVALTREIGGATVRLEPVGVAGLITPWNASSYFVCVKLASALAAGCTAVIKPAELSALQAQVLLECLHEAKLPPGVFNVVNGRGEVVGAELTRSADVAKISFTGSTIVGKTILRDGAATLKHVTLELGGKSPNVLLDDADFAQAIPLALRLCFMNSGQACIAATRLLVPESRLEEVKKALLQALPSFKVGDPAKKDTAIGPMVTKKQYERVQSYIRKGIEEGAEVLAGGEGHPRGLEAGNYVKPTIFTKVTSKMTIAQEEIFGPVLSVLTYRTDEEAVEIANDTQYGLSGYVSGTDAERTNRIASQIIAGRVNVNGLRDAAMAPFGGCKQSGIGREYGVYGIEAYLEPRALFPIAPGR
jgi:aldehyde dehydrogenase (NAD+)